MSKNYFIVKSEDKDSYEIISHINDHKFTFSLSKNFFNTNNSRTMFPIFFPTSKQLELKPGEIFQINPSMLMFGIETDVNKEKIFLSFKENSLSFLDNQNSQGIVKINDIHNLKSHMLSFQETDLETLQFLEKKAKEPNEAIILCYENENLEIETAVLTFKGLFTFFDDELSDSLHNDDNEVGLHYVTNIQYSPVKSSHESFFDDDVEVTNNVKPISLDDVQKYMNISKEDLILKIIDSYPFHFEGDIMDNLNQFSKEKNNFSPK